MKKAVCMMLLMAMLALAAMAIYGEKLRDGSDI